MKKIVLRPYQESANRNTIQWIGDTNTNGKAGLVVLPVAAGKSILIAKSVEYAKSLGYGVIILQPSVELLLQNYDKYLRVGGEATIYSASANKKEVSLVTYVTLGSVKNIASEFLALTKKWIFIMDEAHFSFPPAKKGKSKDEVVHSMFSQFKARINPIKIVGYTATPFILKRNSIYGDSMLNIMTRVKPRVFSEFIHVEQVSTMIEGNYWAPLNYIEYDFNAKLLKFNSTGAEYTEESIKLANLQMGVNRNIYYDIHKLITEDDNAQILVFSESVDIAVKMCTAVSRFCKCGVISGDMPKKKRGQILDGFSKNDVRVIINYGVLTTGYDAPNMTHVLIGRPTGSFSLFYQIQGRVVRPHPFGLNATVIDYCGNIKRFGKISELVIADFDEYGWGATSDGYLLTKVAVGCRVLLSQVIEDSKKPRKPIIYNESSAVLFPFGKYKGRRFDDPSVPLNYVKWMCEVCNPKTYPGLRENLEKYLKTRYNN